MTREEIIAKINSKVRNSAIDAFTDLQLNTILLAITKGSVVASVEEGTEFQQMIIDNPDIPIMAYVSDDTVYTKDKDVVLWRIPGRGIGQVAIDFITDER